MLTSVVHAFNGSILDNLAHFLALTTLFFLDLRLKFLPVTTFQLHVILYYLLLNPS